MSSAVQVYISGRRHTTVHSRVIRRVMNIRGALTHQVQHQNKLWAAHTRRSDHCGVQYHARRGRLLTERSTAVDIGLPSPLDNLEIGNAFDARQQGATGELPGSEEGFIRVLEIFYFWSICLPWCKYFGIGRFCCFIGWWRGCPGEARRMAAWFTFTIAFSTTLISQVWGRIMHLPGGPETSAKTDGEPLVFMFWFFLKE